MHATDRKVTFSCYLDVRAWQRGVFEAGRFPRGGTWVGLPDVGDDEEDVGGVGSSTTGSLDLDHKG